MVIGVCWHRIRHGSVSVNVLDGTIRVKNQGGGYVVVAVNDKYPSMCTMLCSTQTKVAADGIASAFKTIKAAIHAYLVVETAIKTKGVKDEI